MFIACTVHRPGAYYTAKLQFTHDFPLKVVVRCILYKCAYYIQIFMVVGNHSFTKIASHLFPLFFRYGTINVDSMKKWTCALFITNYLKVP